MIAFKFYVWWNAVVEGMALQPGKEETRADCKHTAVSVYFAADSLSAHSQNGHSHA